MNAVNSNRTMLLWLAASMLLASCAREKEPVPTGKLVPAGSIMTPEMTCNIGIFYLPEPSTNPLARLEALLAQKYPELQRTNELPTGVPGIFIEAAIVTNVASNYTPPNMESLRYLGRGLSREQELAVQDSRHALRLRFRYPKEQMWKGLRLTLESVADIAQETGGLLWDEDTRELFSPEAWKTNRIMGWDGEVPNIEKQITIHAYQKEEDGFVRAITLGMAKFGLPDIVVEDFSWSKNRHISHMINLFAQALAEGVSIKKPGEFDLDIRAIRHSEVRDSQVSTLGSNATGVAFLSLREGQWEEGDPRNRLVEITFERYKANDVQARQEKLLSSMFGWEDTVYQVQTDDEELLAASRRARAKLPELHESFNKGLAPGEYILVKVPFSVPTGGSEYMWVEIVSWKGKEIRGLLRNEPENIPDLHSGQNVTVSDASAFDFIHSLPDGTQEGNETGKIIKDQRKGGTH